MKDFSKEFISHHFDKLLLTVLFLILVVVVIHMAHDGRDGNAVNWAREQANLILGALIGLITGALMRNGARPKDPTVTNEPHNEEKPK